MKKVLLSALLLGAAFVSQAQIKAGTFSIGGGLGVQVGGSSSKSESSASTVTVDGPSTFGFSILPAFQYFVADNFSIGLQLGLGVNSSSDKPTVANGNTETSISSTKFSIAPYARYYYMLDENVGFFGQAAISFASQSGSTTSKSGGTSVDTDAPSVTSFGFGLSPGLVFFPGKKVGIEATIGNLFAIQAASTKTESGSGTTAITNTNSSTTVDILNFNTLALGLGFQYYFGR